MFNALFFFFTSCTVHLLFFFFIPFQHKLHQEIKNTLEVSISKAHSTEQFSKELVKRVKAQKNILNHPEFSNHSMKNIAQQRKFSRFNERARFNSNTLYALNYDMQNHTRYPFIAVKMGWEGKVSLEVTVSESGKTESAKIVKSSSYDILDKAALEMVYSWSYKKGDTKEVIVLNFVFQLE